MSLTTSLFRILFGYPKNTQLKLKGNEHSNDAENNLPGEAVILKFNPSNSPKSKSKTNDEPLDDSRSYRLPFPRRAFTPRELRNMNLVDVPRYDSDTAYSVLPDAKPTYRRYSRGGHVIEGEFVNNYTGNIEQTQLEIPGSTLNRFEEYKKNSA